MGFSIRCSGLLLSVLLMIVMLDSLTTCHAVTVTPSDNNERETKFRRGRKMGGGELEEKKDSSRASSIGFVPLNRDYGKANESKMKQVHLHEQEKIANASDTFLKSKPRKNHDEVTKMFKILDKDYAQRARRRGPINNR